MSAPLINNNKQITVKAALRLQMKHQLRKNLRSLLILVLDKPPLKHPLQLRVPVGKLILFLFLQTLFLPRRKILLRRTGNTGPRSVPDLAAATDFKIGIIFASREQLSRIFADQPTVFKVNFAFVFILRNTETGALQYHHPSANNNLVLEQPFLVSNQDDLERLYDQISNIDFL